VFNELAEAESQRGIALMKHVLITGVSTGIGYAAAQAFALKGYHVYGSVRRQVDAEKLQRALGPQFSPLLFDVTDHLAIAEAPRKSKRRPERKVWPA
jgi:NAD(P)-dependent dehydrogenase (short-subunit alcohol dehydrogenase family)